MEALVEKIRGYLPADKVALVERALAYADELHAGQSRRSGGPYIEHPVSVATYLADLSLDATTIAAALLHDVVEDCGVSPAELSARFGADVARLVDGVTKLQRLDLLNVDGSGAARPPVDPTQAESLRKMLVAMAKDVRVVLIKLADRLHNMKTLGALTPERRVAIAQETLDIYAPLAHRLGMGDVKWQLEDMAFRHLQPNQYRSISRLLSHRRQEREAYVRQVTEVLRRELVRAGLDSEVTGRPKHIYSTYQKAQAYRAQGKDFGDIHDLYAVRVLVHSVQDCYAALGVAHALWRPVPGEFDDYIASPKENLYQSLHTTVRATGGVPIEVQVRTHLMHQYAENGVASHWRYKESGPHKDGSFDERMTWLRQLLEWQRDLSGTEDFLESVTTDLFNDQVFVYTPKNEIKELPAGSTPIDFAYRIHTDLGHRCIGSKVNGKLVPLDTQLRNGDTVEILASKVARGPSLDWLNPHLGVVHTATARQAIRAWFRRQQRGENAQRGRDLLKRELRRLNVDVDESEVAHLLGVDDVEEMHVGLGSSQISVAQLTSRLASRQDPEAASEPTHVTLPAPAPSVSVLGVGNVLTRMGECCHPLPGDKIVGYVTRARGVTVHRKDCPNMRSDPDAERMIAVSWGDSRTLYPVRIRVDAWDRVGLLHDITGTVSVESVNIAGSHTDVHPDGQVTITMTLQVASMGQLSRLFSRVEGVRDVRSVARSTELRNRGQEPSGQETPQQR